MAWAFVQALGSNQSKTAGTSLAIAVASLTVTAGNDIFVAFAADDVGSAFSCTDNLGNTYTLERTTVNATSCKALLFRATGIAGGTLTSITVSWTTNITAKAMAAGEYSGVGTLRGVDGVASNAALSCITITHVDQPWFTDDLVVGACSWEGPNGDNLTVADSANLINETEVAQDGTTGGGATSNITCQLIHGLASANSAAGSSLSGFNNTTTRDVAGAGGVYIPAGAAVEAPYPYVAGGYYPSEG